MKIVNNTSTNTSTTVEDIINTTNTITTTKTFDVRFEITVFFKILFYSIFNYDNGTVEPIFESTYCTIFIFRCPITITSEKEITKDFIYKSLRSPSSENDFHFLEQFKDAILKYYKEDNVTKPFIECITKNHIHILDIRVESIEIIKHT